MKLKEVQLTMNQLAIQLGMMGQALKLLADELPRRPSEPHAPPSSRRMTPLLARQIRQYRMANPDETYETIAQRFGVNVGRVSEAVKGKRQ